MNNDVCPDDRDFRADEPEEPPGRAGRTTKRREAVPAVSSSHQIRQRRERSPGITTATSPEARAFLRTWFPGTSVAEWNDWRWQLTHRIRSVAQLRRFGLADPTEGAELPVAITPYYASLIDFADPADELAKSVVPRREERILSPEETVDPLSEEEDMAAPGLVHRYPDRVLFLTTGHCAVYCRYCTRSRMVGGHTGSWEPAFEYIRNHSEIRDVLVSGGDPLTLSDEKLDYLLATIRAIPHVEVIRIGTKVPMVLPQRITPKLIRLLRRYHPLWMSLHTTHPRELTPEARTAAGLLADAGIPLGSQTVLLSGVNDSVETMRKLNQGLMACRIRPYYLYQCDPIPGSRHFRTPVSRGLEIIEGLRGHTSGYAVPQFVIDAPGGGGKIPLLPDYYRGREGSDLLLRNYEGREYRYPDYHGGEGEGRCL